MKKIKALVIKDKQKLEFVQLNKPVVRDYEVLIKVCSCSLCTLDRRVYLGTRSKKMPFLGGHEFSGIVEEIGRGVVEVEPNDKVIVTSAYCNQCSLDRSGKGTQCQNKSKEPQRVDFEGTIQGGGLCEYLVVPAWQVIKVTSDTNLDYAALTEPLACCVHSISKARIKFGDTILIIGLGIMGYFHLKLALMSGARVFVSETDSSRISKAIDAGAHVVINPLKQNLIEEIKTLTDNLGVNVVINTIPSAGVWCDAIESLAPYGKLIAYSSQDSQTPIGVDFNMVHSKEIEIIGSLNPTIEDNEMATKLIRYGLIDMKEVIDASYNFNNGILAFEKALEPGTYRVIINY
ncbi:MAG: alcohol dehydrogenase catalytic domain-containing protein [Bacilli bacterium]